jgi:hypothetical protein
MQRHPPKTSKRHQLQKLPPAPSPRVGSPTPDRRPQAAAIAKLIEGAKGEGKRILVFGGTRQGKTTFTRKVVFAMLEQGLASYILIHDWKYPQRAQYEGPQATTVDKARELIANGNRVIVCRPPMSVEDTALVVRDLVESEIPAVMMIDETIPALKVNEDNYEPINRSWVGPTPIWLLLQGGGLGATVVMLNNLPLQVPTSMTDSSSGFVVFNLGGRSLNSLIDLRVVPREAAENVIPKLQPGECCVFLLDQAWDRVVYGPE